MTLSLASPPPPPIAASSLWSLPHVVSSGLLPSASLSVPPFSLGSVSSGGVIAHIPLSLARRQLSALSSSSVAHRLRQQALVDRLTGAFVAWQQQTADEYTQIVARCKRDANQRIAALNQVGAQADSSTGERRRRQAAVAEAATAAIITSDAAVPSSTMSDVRHNANNITASEQAPSASVSGNSHAAAVSVAAEAEAEAECTRASGRQLEAAQAVSRLAAEVGLQSVSDEWLSPLASLHASLSPWLSARSALSARVSAIKQRQAALQAEKARLTAWKERIKQQPQQAEREEEARQWEAAKQQLAADGARLKEEHAEYERRIAEYKTEEASLKQRWSDTRRTASGDESSNEGSTTTAAALPGVDQLAALLGGLQQLTRANEQLDTAKRQLSALHTAQTSRATLQAQTRQTVHSDTATLAPAATDGADSAHSLGQAAAQPTWAALDAASRQIAQQQRQLTELTQQLTLARQAEKEHSAQLSQLVATGHSASNQTATGQVDSAEPLQPQLSAAAVLSSTASPSCLSCDAYVARCSSLQAALSECAAELSAAKALLAGETARHAQAEAEWRRQQPAAQSAGQSEATERYVREAGERQVQLEDLSRLLDETVRKATRELVDSRASQQRQMEEAVSTLERQQAGERQQWAQQLEASAAAAGADAESRQSAERQAAEWERRWRETDSELTAVRSAFEELRAEAAEALRTRDGLLAQLSSASADIERLSALVEAERRTTAAAESERAATFARMLEEQKRRKEFQFKYEDAKGKVRVYARVRPFTAAEVAAREKTLLRPGRNDWTLELNETQRDVLGHVTDKWREFAFDHVFHAGLLPDSRGNGSQAEVFEETAAFAELSLQGINCCIFAYGQSGTGQTHIHAHTRQRTCDRQLESPQLQQSTLTRPASHCLFCRPCPVCCVVLAGKTWTMAGVPPSAENGHSRALLGLKPRMIERVFEVAGELRSTHDVTLSCYLVEIYLNALEDLFWKQDTATAMRGKEGKWPDAPELKVRADGAKKKVQIDNVRVKTFGSAADMLAYCDSAERLRRVRKTGLNEASSRSHLVFAIMSEATHRATGKTLKGKLSLVDLAGSERADKTNVEGLPKASRDSMLEEGVAINESLRMLKNVFRTLGTAHQPVQKGAKAELVQYRGNMLTELMQDSLGGAAKTLMFVNVGPAASNVSESIDSLQYGDFVKNITNDKASADEDYTEQIRRLKEQLQAYKDKYGEIAT